MYIFISALDITFVLSVRLSLLFESSLLPAKLPC